MGDTLDLAAIEARTDVSALLTRVRELEAESARLRAVAEASREEHAQRAVWLAMVTCTNPPPQALLGAEAATARALVAVGMAVGTVAPPLPACTGITASWCPQCGDCTCPDRTEVMSSSRCPLHAPGSDHADESAMDVSAEAVAAARAAGLEAAARIVDDAASDAVEAGIEATDPSLARHYGTRALLAASLATAIRDAAKGGAT